MDTTQFALVALLVGAVIGASTAAAVIAALRTRDRLHVQASVAIPDGVRDVLHGMDDAAIVVDASATVVAASAAAEPFGLVEGQVVASDELRIVARRARDAVAPMAVETLRLRRGAASSEPRIVAVRATRISPRLTLLVLRDNTERERVEQMRRDFVANTSHELKTPVGAVSLLAEAIESAADDPPQVRAFTARLSAEAARLGELTSRILSLSRLQSADEIGSDRDVAVDEIVASAIETNAVQADSAGIELQRGGDRGLFVRGDAHVLSEAVGNLVANAVAYSPEGSTVGIGVKSVDGIVEIAVTDHGTGISESDQERIFERFYRADLARSRRTGGSGLGLAIVKHAVQRHGGEVRLWSQPGRGSTFTIRLPQVDAPLDEPRGRRRPKTARKSTSKRKSTNGATA